MEEILWVVLQEGVLRDAPNLSTSTYFRNLVISDFKARELLTPEITYHLLTGEPLKPNAA